MVSGPVSSPNSPIPQSKRYLRSSVTIKNGFREIFKAPFAGLPSRGMRMNFLSKPTENVPSYKAAAYDFIFFELQSFIETKEQRYKVIEHRLSHFETFSPCICSLSSSNFS